MPKAKTCYCPNCGGATTCEVGGKRVVCAYCGHTFVPRVLGTTIPVSDDVPKTVNLGRAETIQDFLERAPWKQPDEDSPGAMVYSCPACAAQVVAWQTDVSSQCPYCGNNLLLSGTAREGTIPQLVVPFSLNKERVKSLLRTYCSGKWYLPHGCSPAYEHIQAVFVPFYVHDVTIDGVMSLIGYRRVRAKNVTVVTYRAIRKEGTGSFLGIVTDASSRMPDGLMDAVAPFNLRDLRQFSADYVVGIMAETPDVSGYEMSQRAKGLACSSFVNVCMEQSRNELHLTGITEIVSQRLDAKIQRQALCAMPVWLAHATWDGKDLLFAVNGQTGECVGDLPVSDGKRMLTVLFAFLIPMIVFFAVFSTLHETHAQSRSSGDEALHLLCALLIAFLCATGIDKRFMLPMRTVGRVSDSSNVQERQAIRFDKSWNGGTHFSKGGAHKELEDAGFIEGPSPEDLALQAKKEQLRNQVVARLDESMQERIRSECDALLSNTTGAGLRKGKLIMDGLSLTESDIVLLIHDDSRGAKGTCGFALTTEGFVCREEGEAKPHQVSWFKLLRLDAPVRNARYVRAGDKSLVCYSGNKNVMDELHALCVRLHKLAKEQATEAEQYCLAAAATEEELRADEAASVAGSFPNPLVGGPIFPKDVVGE